VPAFAVAADGRDSWTMGFGLVEWAPLVGRLSATLRGAHIVYGVQHVKTQAAPLNPAGHEAVAKWPAQFDDATW
jgi:hypothetical protein